MPKKLRLEAITHNPDSYWIHERYMYRLLPQWSGDQEAALNYARDTAQNAPENAQAQANICGILMNLQNYEDALKYCNLAIQYGPKDPYGYSIRAQLYTKIGKHDLSQKDLQIQEKLNNP